MIFWDIDIQSWITFDKSVRNLFKADFPPFVHWGPAESKIKMAVVLRAPWGMSLKLEFDPLFMVTWDNQVQESWKLISFPKYDMSLTLSVWLPSSSPGYFKNPFRCHSVFKNACCRSCVRAEGLGASSWRRCPVEALASLFPIKEKFHHSLPGKGQ